MLDSAALDAACEAVRRADGLVIGAGAGMGVDSGLPDFRGQAGFWRAYPALAAARVDFTQIANPRAFVRNPQQAWGFYGHRLNLYRHTPPHEGFAILRELGETLPHGYLVFTSNVDGHFQRAGFDEDRIVECHGSIHHLQCSGPCTDSIQSADRLEIRTDDERCLALGELPRCPRCREVLRPNILLFGDDRWVPTRSDDQWRNLAERRRPMKAPVVIECGAGTSIPTVRLFCETQRGFLIRINPREARLGGAEGVAFECGALEGLRAIRDRLRSSD